ncbi:MAG: DUF502 domain-containing protein [Bacteroidota bacterium]
MQLNKKHFSDLFSYFLRGLLLVGPAALTIYIISQTIHWIDSLIGLDIPFLGMIILVVSITLCGYIGSTLLIKSVLDLTESFISRLPIVSLIYSSLKEFLGAFVGNKKKFDKPVLVVMNREARLHKLGFVTQEDLAGMNLPGSVAVYVPHSYNISGDLFILPKDTITPVNISSAEVTKFIVSGGVTGLKCLENVR